MDKIKFSACVLLAVAFEWIGWLGMFFVVHSFGLLMMFFMGIPILVGMACLNSAREEMLK